MIFNFIAQQILKATKPGQCRTLGRKVKHFNDDISIKNGLGRELSQSKTIRFYE